MDGQIPALQIDKHFHIINPPSSRHGLVLIIPTQNKTPPVRRFTAELEAPF
jgi:hypothetical protein